MGVLRFTSFLKEVVRSGPQNTVYKRKLKKDNNRRQQQRHVRLSYWPNNGQTPYVYLYREVTIDNVRVLHIIETKFAIIVLLLLRNSLSSARLDTRNSLSWLSFFIFTRNNNNKLVIFLFPSSPKGKFEDEKFQKTLTKDWEKKRGGGAIWA